MIWPCSPKNCPCSTQLLGAIERECAADFSSGFIAESPAKLRRILQYFAPSTARPPTLRFAAMRRSFPRWSVPAGRVQPCFFISGPGEAAGVHGSGAPLDDLSSTLNGERMSALRASIRAGERAECKTCVCSMWRDPQRLVSETLL